MRADTMRALVCTKTPTVTLTYSVCLHGVYISSLSETSLVSAHAFHSLLAYPSRYPGLITRFHCDCCDLLELFLNQSHWSLSRRPFLDDCQTTNGGGFRV